MCKVDILCRGAPFSQMFWWRRLELVWHWSFKCVLNAAVALLYREATASRIADLKKAWLWSLMWGIVLVRWKMPKAETKSWNHGCCLLCSAGDSQDCLTWYDCWNHNSSHCFHFIFNLDFNSFSLVRFSFSKICNRYVFFFIVVLIRLIKDGQLWCSKCIIYKCTNNYLKYLYTIFKCLFGSVFPSCVRFCLFQLTKMFSFSFIITLLCVSF